MSDARRPKALLPVLISAGVFAIAAIVLLVWMLSRPAEAVDAAATPTPTATSTPTPTPTEEPAAPVAEEIVLGADGFEIVADDASELAAFTWREDPTTVIAALTEAFGSEPELSTSESDPHFPAYETRAWGGFAFSTMVEEGQVTREQHALPSFVTLDGTPAGDIVVEPAFGLAVGMSADEARALQPDEEFPLGVDGADGIRFVFGLDRATDDAWVIYADTGADRATIESITYTAYLPF